MYTYIYIYIYICIYGPPTPAPPPYTPTANRTQTTTPNNTTENNNNTNRNNNTRTNKVFSVAYCLVQMSILQRATAWGGMRINVDGLGQCGGVSVRGTTHAVMQVIAT